MVTRETKWGRVEVDEQMPRWDIELGIMKDIRQEH